MDFIVWGYLCNAITGNVNDFIENDEVDDFLPVDYNDQPDTTRDKRISDDAFVVNLI